MAFKVFGSTLELAVDHLAIRSRAEILVHDVGKDYVRE
jgi:hypothetical protein